MKVGNDFHFEDLSCLNSVNTLYIYVIFFSTPYLVVYPGFILMGILSSAVSITHYRVEGKIEGSVTETVASGLNKNIIPEIDEDAAERAAGWTSFETPFQPKFEVPRQGGGYNLVVFIVQEVTHPLRSIAQKTTLRDSEFSV